MNCEEAKEFVSVLYDGERVPGDCAQHVDSCETCRESLRAYAQIGAELRLTASRMASDLAVPIGMLQRIRATKRRIYVPRFAVGLAAGLVLALTPSLMMLHAQQQNSKLWFQFEAGTEGGARPIRNVVKAGSDQDMVWGSDSTHVVGLRVAVSEIGADSVKVAVRARRYSATSADQIHVKQDMPGLSGHTYAYVPGELLQIPVEGGGTLVLKGNVLDHQPKFIGDIPVEPQADQLVLSSPALISGKSLLANFKGATGLAEGSDEAIAVYAPGLGLWRFALQPFPGAIEGKATWGNLDFKLNGIEYSVLSATQITGGDQPRAVWVKNDADYARKDGDPSRGFLGIDKLSAPRF